MSRRTPKLDAEVKEAYCQINPADAAKEKLRSGEMISLTTRRGRIEMVARITDQVPEGMLFVPFHFAEACVNILTNPALDPACGMPEYKVCAVKLEVI